MPTTPWGLSAGRTTAAGLCALLIGAGLGAALGHAGGTTRSAQVQLALAEDPQVLGSSGTTDLTTFLQTELVYLNSPALADQVRTELDLPQTPQVSAARVDQSAVVQVTATGPTAAAATARAAAAATTYVDRRTANATQALDGQLASVQSQVTDLQSQLAALTAQLPRDASPGPQALALQSQLQNVLELQTTLTLSTQQASRGAVVIQEATVLPAGTPGWFLGAVVGALLALLALVAALLARMRLSDRLHTPQQLARLHPRVVGPDLRTGPDVRAALTGAEGTALQRAVRLQAAQVTSLGDTPRTPAVVFVGTSDHTATAFAAAQHAVAQARRTPTVLVCAGDVAHPGLAAQFGVPASAPGLTDLGADPRTAAARVGGLLVETTVPGLRVLPAGTAGDGLAALERVAREGLLSTLAGTGARVVVDAPGLDVSSAVLDLARDAGSAVLVVSMGRTPRSEAVETLDVLESAGIAVEAVLRTTPGRSAPAAATPRPAAGPAQPVREDAR